MSQRILTGLVENVEVLKIPGTMLPPDFAHGGESEDKPQLLYG